MQILTFPGPTRSRSPAADLTLHGYGPDAGQVPATQVDNEIALWRDNKVVARASRVQLARPSSRPDDTDCYLRRQIFAASNLAMTRARAEISSEVPAREPIDLRSTSMRQTMQAGCSTAFPFNVQYRVGRIASYLRGGKWLDYGCADGGYTSALLTAGAEAVIGVDVLADRIDIAKARHPDIPFYVVAGGRLVFPDSSFDGVFMNEVFEHVDDELGTLTEVHRVLSPGGYLVLISPNRGFPFEGHTVKIAGWKSSHPTVLIPWLPKRLTDRWVTARNYWPGELRRKVSEGGFSVIYQGFIMPVFEENQWMPRATAVAFRRSITTIDSLPVIRRLGVSNLIIARRA